MDMTNVIPLYVGNIVRVIKQPPDIMARIEGEVAFITEVFETHAQIETLKLDGSAGGFGRVPLDCLAPEGGAEWVVAKKKRDDYEALLKAKSLTNSTRFKKGIAEISKRHRLSESEVRQIYEEVDLLVEE
jgi:hypothetical protein